ncbi:MAG: hypothetical protein Q7T20_11945 [Saprospiraceae bacterium]|nr:hypothetical protein [Saprospiraceae bacterium]
MQRVDDRWKFIIGAKQWVPNAPEACMCEWINSLDGWSHFGPAMASTPEECEFFAANYNVPGEYVSCSWSPASYVLEAKASDGVVLQESAQAFPGAIPHYMDQTNHFQMRNSSKTKEALLKLYEGDLDPWFFTKEK